MQVALMELVEDHRSDALELRVRGHLAEQQRFRHELDPGLGRLHALEANLIADFAAETDLAFLSDTRGQQAGRDSSWLQDDDLTLDQIQVQQHLRDARRLTGARRGT